MRSCLTRALNIFSLLFLCAQICVTLLEKKWNHHLGSQRNLTACFTVEYFLSRVLRDSSPGFVRPSVRQSVCLLVRPSVGQSICHTLFIWGFSGLRPHCSCPNDEVTSNMAPAHPHATGVALYPTLLHNYRTIEVMNKNWF